MSSLQRRAFAALGLTPFIGIGSAWSQDAPAQRKAARSWRLLINEAMTGESNIFVLTSRYQPLGEYLAKQMKLSAVAVEPLVDIKHFMSLATSKPLPELVYGKSVNQLAKLVRDHNYQPVVRRADAYKSAFIVTKDSPIKSLADAGKARSKVIMPDEFTATTALARAELRRQNVLSQVNVVHTRFQEGVALQIKNGFGQVGVVNPTVARKWAEGGGRVLGETQSVVNWSLLAAPSMNPDEVNQLREKMLAMNAQATSLMASLGVKQWAPAERKDFLDLLDYTKE